MATTKVDWYQTESDVTVTLMKKGVVADTLSVDFTDGTRLCVRVADEYEKEWTLFQPIVPDKSSFRLTPTKIEIRLRKASGGPRWSDLVRVETAAATAAAHSYPTSSTKGPKNWDRLEKEAVKAEDDEKLEGDAAVNKLFQQIYRDSSDETKKAMMKSYQESNGTCLSTNWSEVKKETVECKPPDGMEYKKYEK